jgi:CBS domain-containing protein
MFQASRHPLAFVQQPDGIFLGLIEATDATAKLAEPGQAALPVESLARKPARLLTPQDRLSTALAVLERAEFDAAPVVTSPTDHRLVGCVHETDLLRSYIDEADRMRREELGGVGLFAETGRSPEGD